MHLRDTGQRRETLAQKFSVGFHVGYADLDEVVEIAGNHVAFDDLLECCDSGAKLLKDLRRRAIDFHLYENKQACTQAVGIQQGGVALDVALFLQPSDTIETW